MSGKKLITDIPNFLKKTILCAVILFAGMGAAWAQNYYWVGGPSGEFNTSNWKDENGSSPVAFYGGENLYVTNSDPVTIIVNDDAAISNMNVCIYSSQITLELNANLTIWGNLNIICAANEVPSHDATLILTGSGTLSPGTIDTPTNLNGYHLGISIGSGVTLNAGQIWADANDQTTSPSFQISGEGTASIGGGGGSIDIDDTITVQNTSGNWTYTITPQLSEGTTSTVTVKNSAAAFSTIYVSATKTGSGTESYSLNSNDLLSTTRIDFASPAQTQTFTITLPDEIASGNGFSLTLYSDAGPSNQIGTSAITFTSTGTTSIWNGTAWDNTPGNNTKKIIINGNYTVPSATFFSDLPKLTRITINNGATLSTGTNAVNFNNCYIYNNGTIEVNGRETGINTSKVTHAPGTTISFTGSRSSSLFGDTYENLTISSGATLALSSDITINGTCENNGTISGSSSIYMNGTTISGNGNYGTNTVNLGGMGKTYKITGSNTFGILSISGIGTTVKFGAGETQTVGTFKSNRTSGNDVLLTTNASSPSVSNQDTWWYIETTPDADYILNTKIEYSKLTSTSIPDWDATFTENVEASTENWFIREYFWYGKTNTSWDTASNWSTKADPYTAATSAPAKTNSHTKITITDSSSNVLKLTDNITAESITIDEGQTLDIAGKTVTAAITNNGTLKLEGVSSQISGTMTNGTSSTVEYTGTNAVLVWDEYVNLVISGDGSCSDSTTELKVSGLTTFNTTGNISLTNSNNVFTGGVTITKAGAVELDSTSGFTLNSSTECTSLKNDCPITISGSNTITTFIANDKIILAEDATITGALSVPDDVEIEGSHKLTVTDTTTLNGNITTTESELSLGDVSAISTQLVITAPSITVGAVNTNYTVNTKDLTLATSNCTFRSFGDTSNKFAKITLGLSSEALTISGTDYSDIHSTELVLLGSSITTSSITYADTLTYNTTGAISITGVEAGIFNIPSNAASVSFGGSITQTSSTADFVIDYPAKLSASTTFTITKDFILDDTTTTTSTGSITPDDENYTLTISAANILVNHNIGETKLSALTFNGNVKVSDDFTFNASTVQFAATGKSLSSDPAGKTVTISGDFVNVSGISTTLNTDVIISGNFTNEGTINANADVKLTGNFTDNGTWATANGTKITLDGTSTDGRTFVPGTSTYDTIILDNNAENLTVSDNTLKAKSFTISNGKTTTFENSVEIITFTDAVSDDSIIFTAGGTITNGLTHTTGSTSIIGTLTTSNTGVTLGTIPVLNGTINAGTGTATFNNNITLSADSSITAETTTFAGTTTLSGRTLSITGNAEVTSSHSLEILSSASLVVSGDFTNNGTSIANGPLNVSGTFIDATSWSGNGTITFDGTTSQDITLIPSTTYKSIVNKSGTAVILTDINAISFEAVDSATTTFNGKATLETCKITSGNTTTFNDNAIITHFENASTTGDITFKGVKTTITDGDSTTTAEDKTVTLNTNGTVTFGDDTSDQITIGTNIVHTAGSTVINGTLTAAAVTLGSNLINTTLNGDIISSSNITIGTLLITGTTGQVRNLIAKTENTSSITIGPITTDVTPADPPSMNLVLETPNLYSSSIGTSDHKFNTITIGVENKDLSFDSTTGGSNSSDINTEHLIFKGNIISLKGLIIDDELSFSTSNTITLDNVKAKAINFPNTENSVRLLHTIETTSTTSGLNFQRPVTLNADTILISKDVTFGTGATINSGDITLESPNEKKNLTITSVSGDITFGALVGGNKPLGAITLSKSPATAETNIGANITATSLTDDGHIDFTSAGINLTADVTLTGTTKNVTGNDFKITGNLTNSGSYTYDVAQTIEGNIVNSGTYTANADTSLTENFTDNGTWTAATGTTITLDETSTDGRIFVPGTSTYENIILNNNLEDLTVKTRELKTKNFTITEGKTTTFETAVTIPSFTDAATAGTINFNAGGTITSIGNSNTLLTQGTVNFGNDSSDTLEITDGVIHTTGKTNITGTLKTTDTAVTFNQVGTLNGTLNAGTGEVTFNGAVTNFNGQLICGIGNINNTLSGTAVTITNSDLLTIADTTSAEDTVTADINVTTFTQNGTGTIKIAGDISTPSDSGTISIGKALELYGNVKLSAKTVTLETSATPEDITQIAGSAYKLIITADVSNKRNTSIIAPVEITGKLTNASGNTLTTEDTVNITGTLVNNGNFVATSTSPITCSSDITNAGSFTTDASIHCNGNFTNETSSASFKSSNEIKIAKDLTDEGSWSYTTPYENTIIFDGTTAQNITVNPNTKYFKVINNNSSDLITISDFKATTFEANAENAANTLFAGTSEIDNCNLISASNTDFIENTTINTLVITSTQNTTFESTTSITHLGYFASSATDNITFKNTTTITDGDPTATDSTVPVNFNTTGTVIFGDDTADNVTISSGIIHTTGETQITGTLNAAAIEIGSSTNATILDGTINSTDKIKSGLLTITADSIINADNDIEFTDDITDGSLDGSVYTLKFKTPAKITLKNVTLKTLTFDNTATAVSNKINLNGTITTTTRLTFPFDVTLGGPTTILSDGDAGVIFQDGIIVTLGSQPLNITGYTLFNSTLNGTGTYTNDGDVIINNTTGSTSFNAPVTAKNNLVVFNGMLNISADIYITQDLILFGSDYNTTDQQTNLTNQYNYYEGNFLETSGERNGLFLHNGKFPDDNNYPANENYPTSADYTAYSAALTTTGAVNITVGQNFYANGVTATGNTDWNLKLKANKNTNANYARAYYCDFTASSCNVSCFESGAAADAVCIAAEQCTVKNQGTDSNPYEVGWDLSDFEIIDAYTVHDNIICIKFNRPVRNLSGVWNAPDTDDILNTANTPQIHFSADGDANTGDFENFYKNFDYNQANPFDEANKTELSAGDAVDTIYIRTGDDLDGTNYTWNTDATGISSGRETSTNTSGVHKTAVPYLNIKRNSGDSFAAGEPNDVSTGSYRYFLTDLYGKRLNHYYSDTVPETENSDKGSTFTAVHDCCSPVMVTVKTGQELHEIYDKTVGEASQHSYDSHNFIEFSYSEAVNLGSQTATECDIWIPALDAAGEPTVTENVKVTNMFGALSGDITTQGTLNFTGLGTIADGKIHTGIAGTTDATMNALYRSNEYSFRLSIAGYTNGTIADKDGHNYKNWEGYIENAVLPSGTYELSSTLNPLVTDIAGNQQKSAGVQINVDSTINDTYGPWDISEPVFALCRLSITAPWGERRFAEAVGTGSGSTLDKIEFHFFDNTPLYTQADLAAWFTQKGWCINDDTLPQPELYDPDYTYCADIIGGSRYFNTDDGTVTADNRTTGGIRFSTTAVIPSAFKYSKTGSKTPDSPFTENISGVYPTVTSPIFTGSSSPRRSADDPDGLYFGLGLPETNLPVETTFTVSYDESVGYLTDLAGNRLRSDVVSTIDRTPPSIDMSLSPINQDELFVIFVKELVTDSSKLMYLDSNGNNIQIAETFEEIMPYCFDIISIGSDGTPNLADIQVDRTTPAKVQVYTNGTDDDLLSKSTFTFITLKLTRNLTLKDIQTLHLRITYPEQYTEISTDPVTSIKDARVTLLQDIIGNYTPMYTAHALSEFLIGGITPMYAYDADMTYGEETIMNGLYEEGSWAVHDWEVDQQNYGTLPQNHPIAVGVQLDDGTTEQENLPSNVRIFLSNAPDSDSIASQFNSDFARELRVWLPSVTDGLFPGFALTNNTNFAQADSRYITNSLKDGLIFDISKDITSQWANGDQISFLFGLLNNDGTPYRIFNSPYYNVGTGLYEFDRSSSVPLYSMRLHDPSDILSLDLWSFKVRSITEQRGGVTILNNVINSAKGEKTVVKVNMPTDGKLNVIVMTLDGNVVQYLAHGQTTAGEHYYSWNGKNKNGAPVARGMYFIRVVGSGFDETRKVMVVK